jgi:hypothetical protein
MTVCCTTAVCRAVTRSGASALRHTSSYPEVSYPPSRVPLSVWPTASPRHAVSCCPHRGRGTSPQWSRHRRRDPWPMGTSGLAGARRALSTVSWSLWAAVGYPGRHTPETEGTPRPEARRLRSPPGPGAGWSVWHSHVRAACEPPPLEQVVRGQERGYRVRGPHTCIAGWREVS